MEDWLKANKFRLIFITLLVVNILIWSFYFSLSDGRLHIKAYDVGQGDAIFIETASGKRILIDGGPNGNVLAHLGRDLPFYSKVVDLVILTHPDADHLSGLIYVIEQYEVGSVWVNGFSKDSRLYEDWQKSLAENDIEPIKVDQGDRLEFEDGTIIKVIWPEKYSQTSETNSASVVISLSYGQFEAILTGDAEKNVQPYTSGLAQVEFLKVPHHGAKNALDEGFLKTISPEVSFISVGEGNPYGHPAEVTIGLLEAVGSQVYRTDEQGTIEIVTNGESWYTLTSK